MFPIFFLIKVFTLFFFCWTVWFAVLILQPGTEPGFLAVEAWSPNQWTAKELPQIFINIDKVGIKNSLPLILLQICKFLRVFKSLGLELQDHRVYITNLKKKNEVVLYQSTLKTNSIRELPLCHNFANVCTGGLKDLYVC